MVDPLPVNEAERALDAEDDAPRGRSFFWLGVVLTAAIAIVGIIIWYS